MTKLYPIIKDLKLQNYSGLSLKNLFLDEYAMDTTITNKTAVLKTKKKSTKVKTQNYSYDLIGRRGIDTLDKVVSQFDLGICQIGYDGTTVQCSENYIRDKACKTITILKPMKYGTKGWEHLERVAKKYSNYKIV